MKTTCTVRQHTRKLPERWSVISNPIHTQLAREVDEMRIDQMGEILLAEALLLAFADDPEFSDRTQESF